jgi:hypothetical protein
MATLISIANGNFTSASTWAVIDSTSFLDSEAGSTASTTSLVYSSTFTPGAITVDGVAVKIASRTASPTGTITVGLYLNAGSTLVDSATLNATDIANSASGTAYNRGWYFFKFSTPRLLSAATAYKVGFVTSVVGTVTIYRDSTAGNWSRMLRRTTTSAPASGDQLHIIGEHTGAGTGNSFTVTMNNTATTSFGPTVSGGPPQGITVGKRGTLTCGTTASTNYYLKWKGVFAVCDSGTLNIGTSGTPMPSTSTAIFEMDSVANVDSGFDFGNGAVVDIYGDAKFTTTFQTLLNTDEAAASTVLGVVSTAGWANNDEICIASTTQTNSQSEKRTITTVDSSAQVTVSAGLTNAHSGTSPTQAEVGNLTRNVKIRGIGTNAPSTTTTLQGYIFIAAAAIVVIRYTEFYYLGSNTVNKRGFEMATTTGSCNIQYCSLHDGWVSASLGFSTTGATGNNVVLSNNITFNVNSAHLTTIATTGVVTIDNNLFMHNVGAVYIVILADVGVIFTNNTIVGSTQAGLRMAETNALFGTFTNITIHSCGFYGLSFSASNKMGGTLTGFTIWRCAGGGINIPESGFSVSLANITFANLTCFGNSTSNFSVATAASVSNFRFTGLVSNGDATFSTTSGFSLTSIADIIIEDGDFSTVSGIKTAHTNDVLITSASATITVRNTKLGGTNDISGATSLATDSYVSAQRLGTTVGNHKTWQPEGIITIDTILYRESSPSMRMTPSSASLKLKSVPTLLNGFRKIVRDGKSVTAAIWIRKSSTVSGDVTTYNGNQPRFILRKNTPLGITTDTVLATASAANGVWEQLSVTTPIATDNGVFDFFIDVDGTTGWVNVDDFDNDGLRYWSDGLPFNIPYLEVSTPFAY